MGGMFGKSDAPDAPDYSALSEASKYQADLQYKASQEQLDWSRKQWAEQKGTLDQIMSVAMPQMRGMWEDSKADRDRYEREYMPIESDYLKQVSGWDTPERRAEAVAQTQSDISQQFEIQRQNALQRLEGYGIDPSQTRSQALDLGVRMQEATAKAAGSKNARDQIEREGLELKGGTIPMGRGLVTQAKEGAEGSRSASNLAGGAAGGWQEAGKVMGTGMDWAAQAGNTMGNWANSMTQQHEANIGAYNAENAWVGNLMQAAGAGAGAYAGGKAGANAAEGGEIQALPSPQGEVRGPGGPTDDAIPVRMSDKEYVVPADVVHRKGTEFFDKLIKKTQEDLAERESHAQVAQSAMALPPPPPQAPGAI